MDRMLPFRALAWLALAMPVILHGVPADRAALAQGVAGGQPMWINQQPTFQVGPHGAVNLDQQQPYTAGQVPAATYPPQQYAAQPYGAQPWGAQAVAPQPTWGAPWTPATNVGGSIPYFFIHRSSVFGEFLFLRPRDAEVAYAVPVTGAAAPFLPAGPVAVVDPDYEPAFRVGGNWAVGDGNSLAAQYTRFRSEASSSATAAAPVSLLSLISVPPETLLATDASALLEIDFDLVDVDFRGLWAGCECSDYAYAVNYLAGVQYATLDQRFQSSFTTPGVPPIPPVAFPPDIITNVNTDIQFDGIGMRLGLQGERFFPSSGLFVYGSGVTSILFGEFDASYIQDSTNNALDATTSWSAGRVVPVVELELGAGWLGVNRHLRLSAGYRVSAWFNVVKTEDWIWAVQNNDYRDLDGTLTFDGVVGRAEWLF